MEEEYRENKRDWGGESGGAGQEQIDTEKKQIVL